MSQHTASLKALTEIVLDKGSDSGLSVFWTERLGSQNSNNKLIGMYSLCKSVGDNWGNSTLEILVILAQTSF